MRHIGKENRCFVVGVCQAFHKDDIPDSLDFKSAYLGGVKDWVNPGLSLIVDPDGKIVAGPLEGKEGILYADVESHQLVGPRWQLDVAGHYARPDLFELRVRRGPRPFLVEVEEESEERVEERAGEAVVQESMSARGGRAGWKNKPALRAEAKEEV
jgi:nitrilase